MAQVFRPANSPLAIAGLLPAAFEASSRLAMQVLGSVDGLFVVDRMSWRPRMDNAVVYLLLNDQRPIFSDMVAGLAILRPGGARGKIRVGFTREPATDSLLALWNEHPPIVRKRAWPNPVQDLEDQDLDAAKRALTTYHDLLIEHADRGELKRSGTSRPELRMRRALQRMFPEHGFSRARPLWLMGAKGKPLELDIYSESLKIAVEVQGPYHDQPIKGLETLSQQQTRDEMKRKACAERGISLLIACASALDLEIFTLPSEEQERRIGEMLHLATTHGIYEWPEGRWSSFNER